MPTAWLAGMKWKVKVQKRNGGALLHFWVSGWLMHSALAFSLRGHLPVTAPVLKAVAHAPLRPCSEAGASLLRLPWSARPRPWTEAGPGGTRAFTHGAGPAGARRVLGCWSPTMSGQGRAGADLLLGLNDAQRAAVVAPPGPMIVLAGPGSGKTRVLTSRIANLIEQYGAPPSSIVAVTFTNKAANEMRQRLKNVLGIKHDSELPVTVGTFHRVCLTVLREYGQLMGLAPNFLIFDADQQKELVVQAMGELGISTESMQPNTLRFAISNLKSQGLSADNTAAFQPRSGAAWNTKFAATVQRVYAWYQEELRRSNAVDFDDIILETLRLLQQQPEVTVQLRRRWEHILCDEFQDTNSPQYALIQQLAAPADKRHAASIFVVGDADQSIYGWRGADYTNVGRFEAEFGAVRILLERNYRSTRTIVEAAQHVIERNTARVDKKMSSSKSSGAPVRCHQVWSDVDEAAFVAQQSRQLVESGAVAAGYGEIAVMYRTNQQSRLLEELFVRNGVPYQLIGATKFYARKEVKDLLAYLRVLANPDDSVSFLRIVNTPPRGIGKATIDRVQGLAAMWGCSVFQAVAKLSDARRARVTQELERERAAGRVASPGGAAQTRLAVEETQQKEAAGEAGQGGAEKAFSVDDLDEAMASLESALDQLPERGVGGRVGAVGAGGKGEVAREMGPVERAALQAGLRERALVALLRFNEVMQTLREGAAVCAPAETLQLVIEVIELREHLSKDESFDDRWANVGELCKAAARTEEAGLEGLDAFLEEVALVAGDDSELEESIELDLDVKKDPRVKLMTLHSSKGLEFDVVFLVGLVEGKLPHEKCSKSAEEVEEERRLAYVGMTRARELLYMTWYQTALGRGRQADREDADTWLEPSRFLKDLPAHLRTVISLDKAAVEARLEQPFRETGEWVPAVVEGYRRGAQGRGRGGRGGRGAGGWAGAQASAARGRVPVKSRMEGIDLARLHEADPRRGRGRGQPAAPRGGTEVKGPFDD